MKSAPRPSRGEAPALGREFSERDPRSVREENEHGDPSRRRARTETGYHEDSECRRGQEEETAGRRMFDKRELRRRYRDLFEQQLNLWRARSGDSPAQASEDLRVRVCVRKRPLFVYEEQSDEFDVITVRGGSELVVHNCLTKADLRSLFISHMGYQFSHAFDENSTDDEVYERCAAPVVQHVLQGGVASLFMFGQTGSGKTHTMDGLLRRAAAHLFGSEGFNRGSNGARAAPLSLTAFEIAGRVMRDLLDTSPKDLKVMEDKDHRTHVLGVEACEVHSAEELLSLVRDAQAHRATRATQVNDTSSRSHAVFRIWNGGSGANSVLTLVDCAGSERREDSSRHDQQSRKDAAEINSTIFALKECFRVMRSSRGQPPYRESLLTRVLSDSFASDTALIVAVGTVSPAAADTEHSIGTLRALQQLQGTQLAFDTREDVAKPKTVEEAHPRTWSEEEVRQWLEEALGGLARKYAAGVTRGTDGKNLVRWPLQRFTQLCGGEEDLGSQLYQDLRHRIRQGAAA